MDSAVAVLPAKRPAPTGFSSEGCKRLKSSSDGPPYLTCNITESNTKGNSSTVVDYSNPFAISDMLNSFDSGRFGSVTKDVEALIEKKMHILGPYFAQYPALVNQFLKVVPIDDEKAPKLEIEEVTGNNVIDVEREHIKNDDPAAPLSVVINDSDDREKKI